MNWITKLFGDDSPVSSAEIAAKIVRVEAELVSLDEKFDQSHAAMLRASQSGKGDRAERVRVDGLRADLAHCREQLEALRRAHAEALEAEQTRELEGRWEAAQGAGVRLLAAAQRVQLAIDSVGAQYVELITLLDEFTGALPIRAHDLTPMPINSVIAVRLGCHTNGNVGTPPSENPAQLLEGPGDIVHQVGDYLAVAMRARPQQSRSEASTDAPIASTTTIGE